MIRRAEDRDIPQVLCLLEQVNRVHHDIRPDLFRLTTKYTEEELRRIFTDDEAPVFVYDENGQVRGYIFTATCSRPSESCISTTSAWTPPQEARASQPSSTGM